MNFIKADVKLKDAKLWFDAKWGEYKLNIVYELEDHAEVMLFTLKGVHIGSIIPMNHLPQLELELPQPGGTPETKLNICDYYLLVDSVEQQVTKTKTKEMTIEEIEKALGHKIKIVGGDK